MHLPYQVVVSSENHVYMAWQTQLFCYSCLTRLGQLPIVIVHSTAQPLLEEFKVLKRYGFHVIEAPSYKQHPVGEYPPRNEVGSFLVAASLREIKGRDILFCEPDMIFVRPLPITSLLSGEYYSYLHYEEARILHVVEKHGLLGEVSLLNRGYKVGVPYYVPQEHMIRIANRWLRVVDSFDEIGWIDIMYAFGIALLLECLPIQTTRFMNHNQEPMRRLERDLIHYCYGDSLWDKRNFKERSPMELPDSAYPDCDSTSILGEIFVQLRGAKKMLYE